MPAQDELDRRERVIPAPSKDSSAGRFVYAGAVGTARMSDEVAALLQEYADLTAITGGDAFRVRTYEKAARSVGR